METILYPSTVYFSRRFRDLSANVTHLGSVLIVETRYLKLVSSEIVGFAFRVG